MKIVMVAPAEMSKGNTNDNQSQTVVLRFRSENWSRSKWVCAHPASRDRKTRNCSYQASSVKRRKVVYHIHVSPHTSPVTSRAGASAIHLQHRVVPDPIVPFLPLLVLQSHSLPLIPHQLTSAILPRFLPAATAPIPARFFHQADQRFLLRPALLFRHAGEICRAIAATVQCEGDADAVGADGPVIGITDG